MSKKYHIYPIPHEVQYLDEEINLPSTIIVNTTVSLSTAMEKRVIEAISQHGIEITSDADFLVNIEIKPNLSNEEDAYELVIKADRVTIVAVDIFAVYNALNTVILILEQSDGAVQSLEIKDFADYPIRGIVEGYYGIPWGHKKRRDLIDFGSRFKMNNFTFAPKDDPYHREKWFEEYPQIELDELGELARFSYDRGVVFYWTIAPFLKDENEIKEENKEEKLSLILSKFEQIYSVGVRGFGILGDDVGDLDVNVVVYLMQEVNKWRKDKGDVEELIFCPEAYTMEDWAFKDGSELNFYDKHFDEDIHIFYTGIDVCSPLDKENLEAYKTVKIEDDKRRRDPLFWMNWPVNDIDHEEKRRLFMGPGEVYEASIAEITGVLTNPMEQAEASKVAVFATLDYAWNADGFKANKSWEHGFKYIEPNCPDVLHEICKHLASQEGRGAKNSALESVEIEALDTEHRAANSDEEKIAAELRLKDAYQEIIDAVEEYKEQKSNLDLYNEIEAFINALKDKAEAAILLLNSKLEEDKELLSEAEAKWSASHKHPISSNTKNQLYAEAGAKVINRNIEYLLG